MLWGRADGRCSKPDCRLDLYEDETETDDPTLVGENCHIVAESDDGPRPDPSMPLERQNGYNNLILLCRNHHKVIDAQEGEYTVEKLHKMKADHEKWIREQLGFDAAKQKDDEYYADLGDQWQKRAELEQWNAWTSWVLWRGQPSLDAAMDASLRDLGTWLLTRIWPGRYPELESAFSNFLRVLSDFYACFHQYTEKRADGYLETRKLYNIPEWNEERYFCLLARFEHHVDLVQDLMLELTRSANLVCDRVHNYVMPSYRLAEGRLMVESGPTFNLKTHIFVVQYSKEADAHHPYPGLHEFLNTIAGRDQHFGEGRTC